MSNKFELQANQYKFPYHYIPQSHIFDYSDLKVTANLRYGLEYLMTLDKVITFLKDSNADELLDIGCGDGRLVNRIRSYSLDIKKYKGVDLAPDAIRFAKCMNPQEDFQVMNIADLEDDFAFISSI